MLSFPLLLFLLFFLSHLFRLLHLLPPSLVLRLLRLFFVVSLLFLCHLLQLLGFAPAFVPARDCVHGKGNPIALLPAFSGHWPSDNRIVTHEAVNLAGRQLIDRNSGAPCETLWSPLHCP
jgi:hypothetical protein